MLLLNRQICWAGLLLLSSGCMHFHDVDGVQPPPLPYEVKCGGECLELKTARNVASSAMLMKLEEHLRAGRHASAEALLRRRLDTGIELLRERDGKQLPSETELLLARVVDAQLQHPVEDGWLARLQKKGGGGLLQAETTLHRAEALVKNDQWSKAHDLVKNQGIFEAYPFHNIQAGLILAEAQRRRGQVPLAAQTWEKTAILTARQANRWPAPSLWEQLAAQRPAATPWPIEVSMALLPMVPASLHELTRSTGFAPEALVWFAIGNARLQRSEAALALSAMQRADSQGTFADWDDFMHYHQARALLALEQAPAATSLLTHLANRPAGSPWRLSACALLGSGKLQQGHSQQAFAFLREAIEIGSTEFPGRAVAEADLGLVYLLLGNSAKGLAQLHVAQERFQKEGSIELLLTCLENEASYLDQARRTEEARHIRARMQSLQRQAGNIAPVHLQVPVPSERS